MISCEIPAEVSYNLVFLNTPLRRSNIVKALCSEKITPSGFIEASHKSESIVKLGV